jgi:hypothetical protein
MSLHVVETHPFGVLLVGATPVSPHIFLKLFWRRYHVARLSPVASHGFVRVMEPARYWARGWRARLALLVSRSRTSFSAATRFLRAVRGSSTASMVLMQQAVRSALVSRTSRPA